MITDIDEITSMAEVIDNCISTTDCTTRIYLKSMYGSYISFKKKDGLSTQVTEREINGKPTILIHNENLILNSFPVEDISLVTIVKD